MNKYVVRLWLDIEIESKNKEECKEIADSLGIELVARRGVEVNIYQIQTEKIWRKNGEMI